MQLYNFDFLDQKKPGQLKVATRCCPVCALPGHDAKAKTTGGHLGQRVFGCVRMAAPGLTLHFFTGEQSVEFDVEFSNKSIPEYPNSE